MQIYLPIAQISIDLLPLLGIGFAVGILSGMFGIGGGFIMTPILFFLGVPANIAVATQSSQLVGTAASGALVYYRQKAIDYRMGLILFAGGFFGTTLGVRVFAWLTSLGQIELFVSLAYIFLLTLIGTLMMWESYRVMRGQNSGAGFHEKLAWRHWPLQMRFPASRLEISTIPVFFIGAFVGFMAAILGVGGGFILVPAMIYLIGMPTKTVLGTSMFQIVLVTATATMMHATSTRAVDIVLAMVLIFGSVPGASLGAIMALRIPPVRIRMGLGLVIMAITIRLILDLTLEPSSLYSIGL